MSPPGRGRSWGSPRRGTLRCHPGQGAVWGGGVSFSIPNPPQDLQGAWDLNWKQGAWGSLKRLKHLLGGPEWQPKGWWGRIGPGDPKNTPWRGGGCSVPAPGAAPWPRVQGESRVGHPQRVLWVSPSVPHHPRSSVGARGYLLIFTEAAAAPGVGGGGVCFLLGFLFVFQRMDEKEKKRNCPSPALAVAPGLGSGGGTGRAPPNPHCMRVEAGLPLPSAQALPKALPPSPLRF